MPRKKLPSKRSVAAKTSRSTQLKRVELRATHVLPQKHRWIRWGESYTSLLLGIVVVIIAILFVASILKSRPTKDITSTTTVAQPTVTAMQQMNPQTYTVQPGDDLWHIAEKFYQSGYDYVAIAKANNLNNPSALDAGTKLIIPSITPNPVKTVHAPDDTSAMTTQPTVVPPDAIKTTSYTVMKGDDLWHIAIRAYGDGYRWTDIAKINGLTNPDVINTGNVLQLPR